jgi:hypothetical protein
VVLAAALLFVQTDTVGLLGFDAYPIIVTARVQSVGDFVGTFTEKLMDGRYSSDFYRPLLNLTVAFDHALWGLEPWGYQLTSVVLFAGCAWAVFLLAGRLRPETRAAPLAALLIVLLHPLILEVLPVPPRRPELLCGMFMALSLWLQLSRVELQERRPTSAPALLTLLAIASKETGFILPALAFVAVLCYSPRRTRGERWVHAAVAAISHGVAAIVMLAVRWFVIGGLGGHGGATFGFADAAGFILVACGRLVVPQPEELASSAWVGVALAAVFAGLVAAALLHRRDAADAGDVYESRPAPSGQAVGAAWLAVTLAATYAVGNWIHESYFFLPLIGFALWIATAAQSLVERVRDSWSSSLRLRGFAVAALTLLLVPLLPQLRYSPLIHRYDDLRLATELQRSFLEQTGDQIDAAADGTIVYALPMPMRIPKRNEGPRVRGTLILSDYSVQAWAELTRPDRNIRVEAASGVTDGPQPDELLVLITEVTR